MIERNDIPVGSTYDDAGNELTFKESDGFWCESTYDDAGNELTFKNSRGVWEESTYDENGNRLTFKNSDGFWWESTYDENGNRLTRKNSRGVWWESTYSDVSDDDAGNELTYKKSSINNGEEFYRIAYSSPYALFTNANKDFFVAGCREFTKKQALDHWGSRSDKRAVIFTKAIKELS